MNRQEYNRKIYHHLATDDGFNKIISKYYPDKVNSDLFFIYLDSVIESHPDQRFGQIMCNYIVSDYRDSEIKDITIDIKKYLFPGNPDPFFEESEYTYYRLTKEIPEHYKKEFEEKKGKKVYYADGDNTKVGTLENLFLDPIGAWHWIIDGNKVSTSKSITLL